MWGEAVTGAITWEQILFFVGLLGMVSGVWWRIEGKAKEAAAKGEKALEDLASFKLRVAEHYVSKQGLRETTEQILASISGVKDAVDNMTLRVDRIVENQAKPRATRS